jgi:NADPH2:quinone reductase
VKAVVCKSFGPVTDLAVEDLPDPQAGPGEVVVAIEAAGVNFPDGLIVRGEYQMKPEVPFTPGSEAAGTIAAVGEGVSDFAVGDRVIALCVLGGMAEKVKIRGQQAIRIPSSMSGAEASGFSLAYGTAIHALQDKGQLKPGETLLVLGAAGGVGLAAIEVGRAMGATVIAAASSDEKLELARAHGADAVVNYGAGDLKSALRSAAPKGIDVVLDPVGGSLTEAAVRNLRWGGRLLVVGFTQGHIARLPVNLLLLKEAAAIGVFYGEFTVRDPARHVANLDQLFRWFEEGKLRPHIGATYGLEQAADAIQHIMERRALGKVVLAVAARPSDV